MEILSTGASCGSYQCFRGDFSMVSPVLKKTYEAGLNLASRKVCMPEQRTLERARRARREGKAPSTQAGEFVRETIHHIRRGVHGARSTKQAIAIGLSKARRAGVKLPPPRKGTVPDETRAQASRELAKGRHDGHARHSMKRSRATLRALRKEGTSAASHTALARHAHQVAGRKTSAERRAAGRKAARTRKAGQ